MTKRLKLSKRIGKKSKADDNKKNIINLVSPNDITENSLKVWSELPSTIRHDPSLASFRMEHERLHGKSTNAEDGNTSDNEDPDVNDATTKETEFVSIKINKADAIINDEKNISDSSNTGLTKPEKYRKYTKMISLCIIWLIMTIVLAATKEKKVEGTQIVVPLSGFKEYTLPELPFDKQFRILLKGAFTSSSDSASNESNYISIRIRIVDFINETDPVDILDIWKIPTVPPEFYETAKLKEIQRRFKLSSVERSTLNWGEKDIQLEITKMSDSEEEPFAFEIFYDSNLIDIEKGALFGAFVLVVMYILIIWEIVHRTFASMISSTLAIAILAVLGDRPTMNEIVIWMDLDTLILLFSMMTLVALLTETGVFDYIAVLTFEITNGKIWPLIHCLCFITCMVSSLLDNVTTILLMTPITIRLCEVMKLDPVPILMAIVVHANIGGTMTPIGDPPNMIITNNHYIQTHGVTFLTFIAHMVPGVILVVIQTGFHFRYIYRDIHKLRLTEPEELKNLRREITVWQRAAGSISLYSKDADVVKDTLLKKVKILQHKLKKMELAGTVSTNDYQQTLDSLRSSYPIKNKGLLIKSGSVLVFIILLFFLQSVPELQRLSLGWVALLGVILLLIISGRDDMDCLMSRIEWTTLLFFAAMFVTMESLSRLGLIAWIGQQTENIILSVPHYSRLCCAIFLILWISAISSAFVDSIPITAMMVKVVVALAENEKLDLPVQPLIWALAFGPCLGGNGTLYGASANIVCAGIAEQHGYKISFMKFFRIVFPMMLCSVIMITIYLFFCHVLIEWH